MARVTAWLFVESESTGPEELSQIIGLQCDTSWRKDEVLPGRTGVAAKTNVWRLDAVREVKEDPQEVCRQISLALSDIVNRIRGHEEGLAAARELGPSGVMIGVLADAVPPIEINASLLKALAGLNLDLEFDLIVG